MRFSVPAASATAIVLALMAAAPFAVRAETYPSRQVAILVPYAPGGITDVLGRIVAQELSARLGKPFVVENKPGAGTVLAALDLSRAAPDGYTLMMAPNGTLAMNPTLYKSLPYDLKDLKPIALIGSLPFVLVVSPQLPVKNVQELIKLAKEKPGELNYGSGGIGTSGDVFMKLFESISDIKLVHVPFRGSAPQLTATIANQVQVGFVDASSASQMIKSGQLRGLAVSSAKRFAGLPDIPTMQESGVKDFDTGSWQMLVAPAATPATIADQLNSDINAIIQTPKVSDQITKLGVDPGGQENIDQLQAFVNAEAARWGDVITKAGLAGTL
jgi:tripartite-type tricarboxylate transporter receptor subunit TctC